MSEFTEHDALEIAVRVAAQSPCAKSKRGVVVFRRCGPSMVRGVVRSGFNAPPPGFACDGSAECRAACSKLCIHAEMNAIRAIETYGQDFEMLHVEVVDGAPVPSDYPSCWQCSRMILASRIPWMWLLLATGLCRYPADEFHELTLRNCGLPVIHAPQGERP